ncbi:hypothetical protein ABT112_21200 [Streptomyces sp. NPDC002055]|uniref:hypothetical protein n=1 Tax=Streptomyces sp. NPDC002055 TaxID=3154534 RepID=UPI00332D6EAA
MRLPAPGTRRRIDGGDGVKPGDEATVHQLLGRIAYFHTLFIEPSLAPAPAATSSEPCCNHRTPPCPARPEAGGMLADTAWAVLDEIAAALGASAGRCPSHGTDCCPTCRVAESAAAVAETWLVTEHRAYRRPAPHRRTRRACRQAAAARLARTFVHQHHAPCPPRPAAEATGGWLLPATDELPLTGELLALWRDPLADGGPVVSWLNHCTDLDDIRRVLETRRPTP